MKKDEIIIGMLIENGEPLSYVEICKQFAINKDILREMMDFGIFSNSDTQLEDLKFTARETAKIEAAFRLRKDLGINLPGIALALELLEKIKNLDEELSILRKHF